MSERLSIFESAITASPAKRSSEVGWAKREKDGERRERGSLSLSYSHSPYSSHYSILTNPLTFPLQ